MTLTNNKIKNKVCKINTIENDKRMSTQELLTQIYEKISKGYREFEIEACGQQDIGGPLWSEDEEELLFKIKNPGQRVGSMGLGKTTIIVEGSAPADIGWLNSGAKIIVKGDGGDTTSHCASGGKIYIGGRTGSRTGALMKHDPKFEQPQLWILKNTGSFSFEFMGGGIAVVCGVGCENLKSTLGSRSCIGMVGGTIYVRGNLNDVSDDVFIDKLDDKDKEFLISNIDEFLNDVDQKDCKSEILDFKLWNKITAKPYHLRKQKKLDVSVEEFHKKSWVKGGIFGDFYSDDFNVVELVTTGKNRLRIPFWENEKKCAPCEYACPIGIPTQKRIALLREGKIKEAIELIFDYTPFPASVCSSVCPQLCMEKCSRSLVDEHIKMTQLSLMSKDVKVDRYKITKDKKVAIIGAGVSGLSCAWQLIRNGYSVCVYDENDEIGGKLYSVIPNDRLPKDLLDADINRIKDSGIEFKLNTYVDKEKFNDILNNYDAIVISTGAHVSKVIPVEGKEKLIFGLDFLKRVNKGEKIDLGEDVVIIGAGNASMDVIIGCYKMGAKNVKAIDVQKPLAFEKELAHAKSLGAEILYPVFTKKITNQGVILDDGTLLRANSVIISIGDLANLSYLDYKFLNENKTINLNKFNQSVYNNKVFATGDVIKQGLFTDAISDGKNASENIINLFENRELKENKKGIKVSYREIKPEYYQNYSSLEINNIQGYEEDKRCLSCGLCRDCEMCLNACPNKAISKFKDINGKTVYVSNEEKCIGCGICAGVCPCGVWTMHNNNLNFV